MLIGTAAALAARIATQFGAARAAARAHVGGWEVGWEGSLGMGKHGPTAPTAGMATGGARVGAGAARVRARYARSESCANRRARGVGTAPGGVRRSP